MDVYDGPEDQPNPEVDDDEFFFAILGMVGTIVEMLGMKLALQFLMMAWMKMLTKKKMSPPSRLKFRIFNNHKENL